MVSFNPASLLSSMHLTTGWSLLGFHRSHSLFLSSTFLNQLHAFAFTCFAHATDFPQAFLMQFPTFSERPFSTGVTGTGVFLLCKGVRFLFPAFDMEAIFHRLFAKRRFLTLIASSEGLFFGGIRGWAHVPYDFGDDGKGDTSFSMVTVCGELRWSFPSCWTGWVFPFLRILKVFEVDGAGFDGFWASTFSKEAWSLSGVGFWGLGRDLAPEGPGLFDLFEGLLKLKMGCVLVILHEKVNYWMQHYKFSMIWKKNWNGAKGGRKSLKIN
jgi:succinate dehydrogenase/fumarate reductase cytochrome b subunit